MLKISLISPKILQNDEKRNKDFKITEFKFVRNFLINKFENLEKFLLEVEQIKNSRFKFQEYARNWKPVSSEIGTSSKIE